MAYQHLQVNGKPVGLPTGKAVCVGRNYLDHIRELNNPIPEQAILFIKPTTAIVPFKDQISIPSGNCHNELEIAVLVKTKLTNANETEALQALWGVGLSLDLTLRDVQSELKKSGHPWERAKAFDGSCPVGRFVPIDAIEDVQQLDFTLEVNQEVRQQGNSAHMMRSVATLVSEISQHFTLLPGDIVLTGTPKGVGPLLAGDKLIATMGSFVTESAEVVCHG